MNRVIPQRAEKRQESSEAALAGALAEKCK